MKIILSTKYKSFKIPLTILKLTIFLFIANLCARVSIKHQNTSSMYYKMILLNIEIPCDKYILYSKL